MIMYTWGDRMFKWNYINNFINDSYEEAVDIRRDIHKYAEYGWTEFRTASKIAEYLKNIGVKVEIGEQNFNKEFMFGLPKKEELERHKNRAIEQGALEKYVNKMQGGFTGVVGIVETGIPGPTTAFRFDIDANEGIESNSLDHRPVKEGFASINDGAMHSCGHDGHISIGLILAKTLMNIKDNLKGTIKFIFQPAEEGVRGAYSMVNKGVVDNIDYFLTGHIGFTANKLGQIITDTKGFLATTKLDVHFKGRSSHAGASPEKGKNALLAAATAALNLQSFSQHGEGASRVNVGVLNAGTGRNVIPEQAEMKIETRGENNNINNYLENKAREVIKGAATMYDLDYEIIVAGSADSAKSDEDFSKIINKQLERIEEVKEIINSNRFSGSEDATYMMNRVQENGGKAVYMIFGTEKSADHHNNSFDFDERVLRIAIKVYAFITIYLNGME
ncbi:putative amino acid amidohydrolase [Clostridium tetani E88]|uniref:Putative amino acid amidohydrolase n=2 Tax=Clostridium tetani TaxID=1513 RepID=Q891H7_CLOTE|nr:putative amino acid amidohydrolase [Clostridium tetani E88]